jgi:hypothetical protein
MPGNALQIQINLLGPVATQVANYQATHDFMKTKFQFSRWDMVLLITHSVVFGGCLVLLLLGRGSGPLVFLTVGALGMLVAKLGGGYCRAQQSESILPQTEGR